MNKTIIGQNQPIHASLFVNLCGYFIEKNNENKHNEFTGQNETKKTKVIQGSTTTEQCFCYFLRQSICDIYNSRGKDAV